MKNILITGGCGFIGSHFIKRVVKEHPEYKIVNLDKLSYCGNKENLNGINIVQYLGIGIESPIIKHILEVNEIDTIVNFAAESHVDNSIKNPRAFIETDVMGVFNLIYFALKCRVSKIIHISTDEIYSSIEYPIEATEDFPLRPSSPYSASKASGDLLIGSFIKTYNLPAIIIRPCNQYGPNQYAEKLIPATVARLLSGKKALLHGTGKEIREWMYVGDLCRVIDLIMHTGEIGEIYNVGTGVRLTNTTVIQEIVKIMYGNTGFYGDFVELVKNRPGNDKRYALNSSKSIAKFGDYRLVKFKEGLAYTIDWYRKNKWFWENTDLESNRYSENYLR